MPRYYISFSYQDISSLGIASVDVTTTDLIATVDDLQPVYGQLAQQGYYDNVKILAFSLYATPTPAPTSRPQSNPAPRANPAPQQPRRRPSPRPGRHS